MIPAPFDYVRAGSVEEAVALLVVHGDEAKVLAGGHSLVPLLRLRFARPSVLVDIGRLRELSYIRDGGDHVAIGALTRYRDLEVSPLLAERAGLVVEATRQIGDPQVRHRGTIGGAICHADPAADLPAVLVALGAQVVVRGPSGERNLPASEMFLGFLETALEPGELLTEIRIPESAAPFAFEKFTKRSQDWAVVGCAVVGGAAPRVALVNMGTTPLRATATEEALAAGATTGVAAGFADEGTEPTADLGATADYRRHLARVLVRRALERVGAPG